MMTERWHEVFAALLLGTGCMMGVAEGSFEVASFSRNGELTWAEHPDMARYKV